MIQVQRNNELEADKVTLAGQVSSLQSDLAKVTLQVDMVSSEASRYKVIAERVKDITERHLEFLESYSDSSRINGEWRFKYDQAFEGSHYEEMWNIKDGVVDVRSISDESKKETLKMRFYFYDPIMNRIVIILTYVQNSPNDEYIRKIFPETNTNRLNVYARLNNKIMIVHELNVKDDRLEGLENGNAVVSYQRIRRNINILNTLKK